ncbi:PIN domain-containing protein [Amazonocrinis nigriterrae]|uniref:type II toxin-antitoxin system VapC family toxin n=1 Tax=Amazonocrinis nigriterrae TaxID=2840443 RepID=UPI001CEC26FA|nr:type II toxin-antitoxin system VapC family toxin [Amazonocrinis nigriterrae]
MAKLYILDTDHVSLFQQGNPTVIQRISQKKPENLAVTVITLEEKIKGWLKSIKDCNSNLSKYNTKLVWAYKGLADEIEFFKNIRLLAFDNDAYAMYQLLLIKRLKGIGT